jgi:hypothetical protein
MLPLSIHTRCPSPCNSVVLWHSLCITDKDLPYSEANSLDDRRSFWHSCAAKGQSDSSASPVWLYLLELRLCEWGSSCLNLDLFHDMNPGTYPGQTEEPSRNQQRTDNNVETEYKDLVNRIDTFLKEDGDAVRKGTQARVQESLQVIQKALTDYRYPLPPWNPPTLVSTPLHCHSTVAKIVLHCYYCIFIFFIQRTPQSEKYKPVSSLPRKHSPKSMNSSRNVHYDIILMLNEYHCR